MKFKLILMAVAGLALMTGSAMAQTPVAQMNVQMIITNTCTVTVGNGGLLDFGTSADISGAAVAGTTTVAVDCTNPSTPWVVTMGNGSHYNGTTRRMDRTAGGTSGTFINYALYSAISPDVVWNTVTRPTGTGDTSLTVYGRIPAGQSPPAGTYTDTVQVEVTW